MVYLVVKENLRLEISCAKAYLILSVSFKSFFVKKDLRSFYNSPCFTCVMSISHRNSGLHSSEG